MSTAILAQKAELRRRLLDRLKQVQPAERETAGRRFLEALQAEPVWRQAHSVLLFTPMETEPDIRPVIEAACREGKVTALPRYVPERKDYVARGIRDLGELQPGFYGLLEPSNDCPIVPLMQLDFVLVPGVAFDVEGRRLGRGKGFYDRLLARVAGHKCGAAFDWQVVPEVPWEPHDVVLDSLLTPSFGLRVAGPGAA